MMKMIDQAIDFKWITTESGGRDHSFASGEQ